MFVVTGAAGRLGNVLVRALKERFPATPVRALALPNESVVALDGVDCEIVRGDIRDLSALTEAFKGATAVFHVAGLISLMPDDHAILDAVNVQGTANVISAAKSNGVKRLIYTASSHALEEPGDERLMTEAQPLSPKGAMGIYGKSKAKAALLVLQAAREGLDALVVCPTGILGPLDHLPSHQGGFIIDAAKSPISFFVHGAYDFVDVRDVAAGHILAYEKGRSGEYYLLSGERITLPEMMRLARGSTRRGYALRLGIAESLARLVGSVTPYYYRLTKAKPVFTSESIDVVFGNSYFSSHKARTELGYSARPVFESIRDTVRWFQLQGRI